ncbi:hypothetical protein ACP70R_024877 [Stipagrostis hirtigluma subsp. patula]
MGSQSKVLSIGVFLVLLLIGSNPPQLNASSDKSICHEVKNAACFTVQVDGDYKDVQGVMEAAISVIARKVQFQVSANKYKELFVLPEAEQVAASSGGGNRQDIVPGLTI